MTDLRKLDSRIGGRKPGRCTKARDKELCLHDFSPIVSGPIPALNFRYCPKCRAVTWAPPDRRMA